MGKVNVGRFWKQNCHVSIKTQTLEDNQYPAYTKGCEKILSDV